MIFNDEGIILKDWKTQLAGGQKASLTGFLNQAKDFNLRNSIFVDITANNDVAQLYSSYLKHSIAVVACNKIACSSEFEDYSKLKTIIT